jgi:hypothetical protein
MSCEVARPAVASAPRSTDECVGRQYACHAYCSVCPRRAECRAGMHLCEPRVGSHPLLREVSE